MKPEEYRKMSVKELEKELKNLGLKLIRCHGNLEKTKIRKDHQKNYKKEIARIKTILKERGE